MLPTICPWCDTPLSPYVRTDRVLCETCDLTFGDPADEDPTPDGRSIWRIEPALGYPWLSSATLRAWGHTEALGAYGGRLGIVTIRELD
jgi:hypothetical protein